MKVYHTHPNGKRRLDCRWEGWRLSARESFSGRWWESAINFQKGNVFCIHWYLACLDANKNIPNFNIKKNKHIISHDSVDCFYGPGQLG